MHAPRREFLKQLGVITAAGAGALAGQSALASGHASAPKDPMGVLVDLTICVGCRLCEHACKKANGIDPGDLKSYDDQSVFQQKRRPVTTSLTVLNSYPNPSHPEKPIFVKTNCFHCNHAACVSACIVGALQKKESGAVIWEEWRCIGCRYCMVACPFQIPAYSYDKVLTPQIRKCQFCFDQTSHGQLPACVRECPRNAMTYGKRSELLHLAHEKIASSAGAYVDHIYGEHEVGGTSWMYISSVPFEQAGFLNVGNQAPPVLTEAIQHGVFKYWIAPVGWYSVLGLVYWLTGRRAHHVQSTHQAPNEQPAPAIVNPGHHHAAPIPRKLLTPGVWLLLLMVLTGMGFWIYRMSVGLAASTNLTNQRPWGLWIAMDVGSGIALAGGGFVSCAIFHVFHRHRYHTLARSALITALLGYTFYVPGLLADLGRWYKLPITMLPNCWQGNSVLFEVGMCVMIYLNVQYAELMPIIFQRLLGEKWFKRFPRIFRLTQIFKAVLDRMMPALLCLGVCLSTFHQSSLGNLMNIAPYKLDHLWWGPLSPLLFFLSAAMVGLPMVIFTILFASWSLNREPEIEILAPLARRYVPCFMAAYIAVKIADMLWRGTWRELSIGSTDSMLWMAEMALIVIPLVLFLTPAITRSPRGLAVSCLIVILGVVLNRLNVLVLGFHPPYETRPYIPSLTEFMVSMGLVAALMLVYRIMVTYLPILEPRPKAALA